jgi:hypothetical protein
MGDRRGAQRDLVGRMRERDHLEDLGADGRIILSGIEKHGPDDLAQNII